MSTTSKLFDFYVQKKVYTFYYYIFVDTIKNYFSFDFCLDDHETGPVENLGQVVFGERIRSSPYKVCYFFP